MCSRACSSVRPMKGSTGTRMILSGNFSARSSMEVPPSLLCCWSVGQWRNGFQRGRRASGHRGQDCRMSLSHCEGCLFEGGAGWLQEQLWRLGSGWLDVSDDETNLHAMIIGPAVLRSRTMAKYFSSVRLIFFATRRVLTGLPCRAWRRRARGTKVKG